VNDKPTKQQKVTPTPTTQRTYNRSTIVRKLQLFLRQKVTNTLKEYDPQNSPKVALFQNEIKNEKKEKKKKKNNFFLFF
jgi:hypothetical protein